MLASRSAANGYDNPGFQSEHYQESDPAPPYPEDGSDNVSQLSISSSIRSNNKGADPEAGGGGGDREQWDKPIEFLFSCISLSVGLGNIWRFPFTAYENGGGAFLIPYLIVLFVIGKPLYFLEMAIGQFASSSQVKVWKMVPFFKGVGYGSAYGCFCVLSYYCILMAITVFYLVGSFQTDLPWTVCRDEWENITCVGSKAFSGFELSGNDTEENVAELYFKREVLQELPNIDDGIGAPEWRLTLCLLASWIIIYGSLVKGVKSSGKVAYFTALFPYFVLTILLIRGLTLDGAWEGVKYFISPDWVRLKDPTVWSAAVGQCFFSLSVGFGPIIMFSSFSSFKNNVYRDAMIISLMDTFTSLLAGVTIFAILGNLAHESGSRIQDVVGLGGGAGLAFVSYPSAIATFQFVPQLFAVLFFLMLFTLGVGSAAAMAGGVISVIHDGLPNIPKSWVTAGVCIAGFLSGLLYATPGGQFMLNLVNDFAADFVIYMIALIETIAIAWFYGVSNITRDIEFMIGRKLSCYWKICWGLVIPVGLSILLVYSMATSTPGGGLLPPKAIVCGWLLGAGAMLFLPIGAAHAIAISKGNGFVEKLKESLKPKDSWGPKNAENKLEWKMLPEPQGYFKTFAGLSRRK